MTARLRLTTAVAVLVAALLAPAASAQQPVADSPPGIAVTGRAVSLVTNDTATFRFSVSSRRTTAAAALRTAGDGPELTASDPGEAYRRALAAAFVDARSKAERLAAQAGVALGRPVRLVEGGADAVPEFEEGASAGGGGDVVVRGGRTRVEATLVVTFAIG